MGGKLNLLCIVQRGEMLFERFTKRRFAAGLINEIDDGEVSVRRLRRLKIRGARALIFVASTFENDDRLQRHRVLRPEQRNFFGGD